MDFTPSPTELTTSISDAVLAVECLVIRFYLRRDPPLDSWRVAVWSWVFGLMAFSSLLGAALHGFPLTGSMIAVLWRPLYLSMGILVALVPIAAVYDWRGHLATARLIPYGILAGIVFLVGTEIMKGEFLVFVVYDVILITGAMAIYLYLSATHRVKGARLVAIAMLVNIAAGGVQASDLTIQYPLPLDHNGLFHLVQMIGTAMLGIGVQKGMPR